jgi:peptide chain release factor 1
MNSQSREIDQKLFPFYAKCKILINRFNEINDLLLHKQSEIPQKEQVVLKKEISNIEDVFDVIKKYTDLVDEYSEYQEILSENSDQDLVSIAKEESPKILELIRELDSKVKAALLPKDSSDSSNVIIEVRAGTGGDEASLFAMELFRMYLRYCENKNWKVEILDISANEQGGYKEASVGISGKSVFGILKFESGTHRVQRIPVTESKGRVHTSAVTVAVLPEPEEIEIQIDEKDLRIDIYRASGNGGQCVNTTDSAVRLTHLPTGLVVIQQDEKSQHKNKAKAMRVLKARLFELEREKRDSEIANSRKSQIGSGDRSEKIRTYNFPQDRVTDHRIGFSLNHIGSFMDGDGLGKIVEQLKINEVEEYFKVEQ